MKALRVLVVDDDRDTAEMLAVALQSWGHIPQVAYDGAEAIILAPKILPQVVLLDLAMPGLDGVDVATRFRAQEWGAEAKIIAITGLRRAEDLKLAESVGIDFYLLKPADLKELQNLLSRIQVSID